jgi:phosphoribosylaminoimidazole-succinocarboxamide synthase
VTLIAQGKVRDVHDVGGGRLVMVTSDRISAYDVVMPTPIPGKGQVLTALSVHWFARLADIVPNHLLGWRRSEMPEAFRGQDHVGRVMLVRRLDMLPVECVVRGYLAGSGWRDYRATGATSGHALPAGLRQADPLPEPLFAPATKAHTGHDENIPPARVAELVGRATAEEAERIAVACYRRAAADCRAAGIILADTKLELGRDPEGRLVLGDEAFTSDSSRFWPADRHVPGASPPSFDKQYLRDWLDSSGWDHSPPAPRLPDEVVEGTRARYVEAYERITGRSFADWLEEAAS